MALELYQMFASYVEKKVKKEVAMFADDTAVQRVKLTMKTCKRILAVFY